MNDLATAPLVSGPDFWMMILKSLGMLCVVLGILIGILFLIRKFSLERGAGQDKSLIRMMSSFYLSPKERVVLLDVMDRKILIGVTQNTITRISEFEGDPTPAVLDDAADEPFFKGLLQRLSRDTAMPEAADLPLASKSEA